MRGTDVAGSFVDPSKTVQKITLPYTGTGMLTETCNTGDPITAALRVFAMAPRPASAGAVPAGTAGWLGSWAAPVDTAAVPPGGAGFGNQTIRTIVRPNETGAKARFRLSNTGAGTTGSGAGTLAAPVSLTFAGNTSVTLPAGAKVLSDPVDFPATTGGSGNLVVSLHLPNPVAKHRLGRRVPGLEPAEVRSALLIERDQLAAQQERPASSGSTRNPGEEPHPGPAGPPTRSPAPGQT